MTARKAAKPRFTDTVRTPAVAMVGLAEGLGIPAERDRMAAAILAASGGHHGAALWELKCLRDNIAALEDYIVTDARRSGSTWDKIGRYVGITKQAAAKRWRRLDEPAGRS